MDEEESGSEEFKEFSSNVFLIKALVHFVSPPERKKCQEWLKKLMDIQDGSSETKCRNEYSHYLLLTLQKGTLSQPFDKYPSSGRLKPLCRILPEILYEEVVKQIKASHAKVNNMIYSNNENFEMPDLRCEPPTFNGQHPRPLNGVTAMCAVFSNYDEDAKNLQK